MRGDEAPADSGVFQSHRARECGVCFAYYEGRARHAFYAAGDDEVGFAALDGAGGAGYRIHAGAAESIYGCAGNFFRQAGE